MVGGSLDEKNIKNAADRMQLRSQTPVLKTMLPKDELERKLLGQLS
jgi:hypothetical protein